MSKFKVDDEVVVTDSGETHSGAEHWVAGTQYEPNWKRNRIPNNGDVGTIMGRVRQTENYKYPVYFVRIKNSIFTINTKGLCLREEASKSDVDSITFREIREKYTELFSDQYFSIDLFGQYTEVNYGEHGFKCDSEKELFSVLDALTLLAKFKVQQ